jgi:toxin CcdB
MPQFGIYKHPGRDPNALFVVQIQSSRLERSAGRAVIPLIRRSSNTAPDHPLTPHLHIAGEDVIADPFDLATIPVAKLGPMIDILPERDQDAIIRALDELTSRA